VGRGPRGGFAGPDPRGLGLPRGLRALLLSLGGGHAAGGGAPRAPRDARNRPPNPGKRGGGPWKRAGGVPAAVRVPLHRRLLPGLRGSSPPLPRARVRGRVGLRGGARAGGPDRRGSGRPVARDGRRGGPAGPRRTAGRAAYGPCRSIQSKGAKARRAKHTFLAGPVRRRSSRSAGPESRRQAPRSHSRSLLRDSASNQRAAARVLRHPTATAVPMPARGAHGRLTTDD